MNRRTQLLALFAALLGGACSAESDAVRIIGELASDRVELTAEANEPITEILVAEGEQVAQGQVLLRQDARRAESRLAEADAAVLQAQARLDELVRGPRSESIEAAQADYVGATTELEFRQGEYKRIQDIYALDLASPQLLARSKSAVETAEASKLARHAHLQELLTGTTVEELTQAEQAVAQAAARRDLIAVDVARHETVAPVAGIVDSRLFEVGERPSPGQAMLILLPGEQPHARVYVPEEQRLSVRVGSAVKIMIDGMEQPLDGRVRWVASEAMFTPYFALTERDRGHLTYAAKIDIDTDGDRLPDGIPVSVEL